MTDRPPRLAEMLLGFCAPGAAGEALLGDLAEELADRVALAREARSAHRWYWSQVLRSLWPALTVHVHRGSIGRLCGALFLGVAILWVLGDLAMTATLGGLEAVWPGPAPGSLLEVAYLAGLAPAAVLAGFAAARHGRQNGPLAASALASLVALPGLVAVVTGVWSPPYWSHFLWFVLGPLGVFVGARLGVRTRSIV